MDKRLRADFPILARKINGYPLAYLDNAATSQKPKQVIDAISKFYKTNNANVHRGIHTLTHEATAEYDKARGKVAKFVGIDDQDEIIFVRNTDEAINLVAYAWGRGNIVSGDEIVLTIAEHHSNFVPWQQLAQDVGAIIKIVPIGENGGLDLVAFKKAVTKKTKVVTFFHVSNVLGTINNVRELVKIVRAKNSKALIVVDGAQAVPHMKVDISKLGCDFYAFSAHKMLGPSGVGVLWGKREILEKMPPFLFGGDMISRVKVEKSEWSPIPLKFEAGTPNIEGAIGFGAAVDYLTRIGMEKVRDHEVKLTRYALSKLLKIPGFKLLGPKSADKRCGVIAFIIGNVPPHDIASIMDSVGVEIRSGFNCAEPLMEFLGVGPVARASFYIYNTKEEVDRLVDGVKKVKEIFKLK